MAITISNWYTEYRTYYPPENHQAERRDLDYPLDEYTPRRIHLQVNPRHFISIFVHLQWSLPKRTLREEYNFLQRTNLLEQNEFPYM